MTVVAKKKPICVAQILLAQNGLNLFVMRNESFCDIKLMCGFGRVKLEVKRKQMCEDLFLKNEYCHNK